MAIYTHKISGLCWKLNGLYISIQQVKNEKTREELEKDIVRYSTTLSNAIMLVVTGIDKIKGDIDENDFPRTILGYACRALLVSLKAFMEAKDNEERERASSAVKRSLAIFLEILTNVVEGNMVDLNRLYDELKEIEGIVMG